MSDKRIREAFIGKDFSSQGRLTEALLAFAAACKTEDLSLTGITLRHVPTYKPFDYGSVFGIKITQEKPVD